MSNEFAVIVHDSRPKGDDFLSIQNDGSCGQSFETLNRVFGFVNRMLVKRGPDHRMDASGILLGKQRALKLDKRLNQLDRGLVQWREVRAVQHHGAGPFELSRERTMELFRLRS